MKKFNPPSLYRLFHKFVRLDIDWQTDPITSLAKLFSKIDVQTTPVQLHFKRIPIDVKFIAPFLVR